MPLLAPLLVLVPLAAKGRGGHSGAAASNFRSIDQFVTPEQQRAARHGAIAADVAQAPLPGQGKKLYNVSGSPFHDRPGNWHSQAGQDRHVFTALAQRVGGYFVDLAANDPIKYSNTRTLERDYGWSGVCIDGNQRLLEKLAVERTCRVVRAVVTDESGKEIQFTAPVQQGSWEDTMGGVLSESTDNRVRRPAYASRQWRVEKHTTVTLTEILQHVNAPPVIDYLSLDVRKLPYVTAM